jgi:tetratricopeptide (TPR) repeat protein
MNYNFVVRQVGRGRAGRMRTAVPRSLKGGYGMFARRGFVRISGVLAVIAIAGGPVAAEDRDQCASAPTPELHILACTATIEGGEGSPSRIETAYINRGLAYFSTNDVGKALDDFNKAVELSPRNSIAYEGRAIIFASVKQYDRALADDLEALKINPYSVRAYNNSANLYKAKGDLQHAIEYYDDAIKLAPNEPKLYFNRANSLKGLGKFRDAISDYDRALDLDHMLLSAYINRGSAYEALGDLKSARADLDRVLQIDPMNNAAIIDLLEIDRLTSATQPSPANVR